VGFYHYRLLTIIGFYDLGWHKMTYQGLRDLS